VVLAFFECTENPAAEPTLAKYKDVVCWSDEHNAAMPAMAIGLVLYVVGFYLTFLYSAWIAPSKWMDVEFRQMWKFMLTRWRPDVWFWGCVVMTRNLLVAFAGVISSEPRVQLVYVVCVVVIVFSATAFQQPWRAPMLNYYDVASSIVLVFIGIFGLIFVSSQAEVVLVQRLGADVTQKEDEQAVFAQALTALISVFMALFGMLVVWCLGMLVPSQSQKLQAQHVERCGKLIETLEAAVRREDFMPQAARLINESTAFDRAGLENFITKVFADHATRASGATDTITINKAKARQHGVLQPAPCVTATTVAA